MNSLKTIYCKKRKMKKRKPKNDITGQIFGDLKVVSMKWETKQFVAVCDCLNCGKKNVVAIPSAIKSGHKQSCGCKAKYIQKQIVGQRFGMLFVIDLEKVFHPTYNNGKGKFKYYALCKCDCGNEHRVLKGSLQRGATTSCGCKRDHYNLMRGDKNSQFTGFKEITGKFWSTLQVRSKRRGHVFDLKIEDAWNLYEKQNKKCALTGVDIFFGNWNTSPTASLDRIDNTKGYYKDNVQWVHKHVNIMRNVFSIEYFLETCKRVVENASNQIH